MQTFTYEAVPAGYNPFSGPEISYTVPTTESQKEIWISCMMGGEDSNRSYNESVSIDLLGTCNRFSMAMAIKQLVSRHESLRSTFSADGQDMMIYRECQLNLAFEDISQQGHDQQQRSLSEFADRDGKTCFDLANGPLFRPVLFKLSDQQHRLRLTAHHIVCDGWSMGVIINEVARLYSGYVKNEIPVLSPPPLYSEFAIDQLNHSLTTSFIETENYWIRQFTPLPSVLNLPLAFERPARRTFKSHRDDYTLDGNLVSSLKKVGAKHGCSLATTMIAGFELLLHHLTGQTDITIGIPASGQSATGNDNLVGHCANLLPIRSFQNGQVSIAEYLRLRKAAISDAYDHQGFTFGNLLKKLPITRDSARLPLVPVVLNFDRSVNNGVSFQGLSHRLSNDPRSFETFEIFVNVVRTDESTTLQWSYNTSLFDGATIANYMLKYEAMLNSVVANQQITIAELRSQFESASGFVYKGNNTAVDYPRAITLPELIRKQSSLNPLAVAITFRQLTYSYEQVNFISDQFAAQLIAAGTVPGDIIGVILDRSPLLIISMIAVMKTGAAYVPVDPDYPKDRIDYMLKDASARFVLTSSRYSASQNLSAKILLIEDLVKKPANVLAAIPAEHSHPEGLAYILYTSGSTGKPKGVKILHYNLVNMLVSVRQILKVKRTDRLLAITTVCFDISGMEFFLPLISGASIDLAGSEVAKDGFALLEKIRSSKPTIMQATPATWQMLLEAGWKKHEQIPLVCTGGEALSPELSKELLARSESLFNLYGPTETTIWSSAKHVTGRDNIITIGQPIANTRFYILDEAGKPVNENEAGEMYIAGDGVGDGYHNQPLLTAEKFIPDPFSRHKGAVMYRTGDLGKFLPNGDIQCLGRIDQQIKIRGYRIEPGEIEYCLSTHTAVTKSVVISREDHPGNKRLVAYVVLKETGNTDPNQLVTEWKQSIRNFLPAYMCPNDFVIIPDFPLTPNGKIDRKSLPRPETIKEKSTEDRKLTRNEKILTGIWSNILGVANPGLHDDFFELGGHSLIAIRMMGKLEKETGIQLPVSVLFDCPTIASLASRLEEKQPVKLTKSLVVMKKGGNKMPLYLVHGARGTVPIFNRTIEHLDPDQPIYGLQAKGLDGNEPIVESIEELASNYIDEIIESNPDGPYALGGYSFGGLVAFEMARQLKAMKKDVKALIIFDTYADGLNASHSWSVAKFHSIRIGMMRTLYDIATFITNPIGKIRYEKEAIKTKLHKPYRRLKTWIAGKDNDLFYYKYKIEEINLRSKSKYLLRNYDGVIELFRAGERTYYQDDHLYLGWKPYAKGGVRVHEIPGEHNKIFLPPNVDELALKLQACLNKSVQKEIQEITLFYQKRMLEAV